MKNVSSKKTRYIISLLLALLVLASLTAWYFLKPAENTADLYPKNIMAHAKELHDNIISIDGHINVPLDFNTELVEANIDTEYQFDLVKAESGQLSGAALTILGWPEIWNGDNAPHRPTLGMLEEARQQQEVRYKIITNIVRDYPDQVDIAYTAADFRRLFNEKKFAIIISMLNAYPLANDISQLDKWAARGMRVFGFSYVGNNSWSDSSRPMPFFNDTADALDGLSVTGQKAVHRLNDLGVVIDVSQMSSKAVTSVSKLSRAPIIASHSAMRGIVDIPRNISDKELQLIKNTGGMVHVVGFSTYLKPLSQNTLQQLNLLRTKFDLQPLQMQENLANAHMPGDSVITIWSEKKFGEYASALYEIMGNEPKSTLKDYCNHIDYAVKKMGIDHVGISSDFNDGGGVEGWMNVNDNRNITAELIQRGYSDIDIAKLWGGNFLRVWQEVESLAKNKENKSINN
ncbi:MAG: membrane dipeptidase [Colwellia sp.]|nr:membrane dipeptidase [Colwellia sp.]